MTTEQINRLISSGEFPEPSEKRELIETHISWVILCDRFVYKIKKPVHYSFLDFSSADLRNFYCHRELELNRRLTPNVYLEVLPVRENNEKILIGGEKGEIIDYALKMNKLDPEKRMDKLLMQGKVKPSDIKNLAEIIAAFHKNTAIIYQKEWHEIREKFNDLLFEKDYLGEQLSHSSGQVIQDAIDFSNSFLDENRDLIAARLKSGMYRDGHGDLHSRNIFLIPQPVPFDCIEFNDDFRQTDVLNEIAFMCMDLDAFGFPDLSEQFMRDYNSHFPAIKTTKDKRLFIYYKIYRANVRAKVNSLRARSAATESEKIKALSDAKKYLDLMKDYLKILS
ncbi:MAG: hypothetical protein J0H55_14755 [Chitinophagaceae bacterium]|nr:hypothetical protein [Chitinophagaceae bacterium]